jgi:chaperonin GroES
MSLENDVAPAGPEAQSIVLRALGQEARNQIDKQASRCPVVPAVGRMVVKVKQIPKEYAGGLITLSEKARRQIAEANRPTQGEVWAVADPDEEWKDGTTGEIWKPIYSPGDTVIFGRYSGVEVEIDGHSVIILNESDILAKLNKVGRVIVRD